MKIILGLFLCLVLAGFTNAQNKACELTLEDMPAVRGLRLGMSKTDFAKILPAYNNQVLGVLRKPELSNIFGFENIEKVLFAFFNRHSLGFFSITYDKNFIKWKDAKDFTQNLPDNSKLPAKCWTFSTDKTKASIEYNLIQIELNSERNTIAFGIVPPSDIDT